MCSNDRVCNATAWRGLVVLGFSLFCAAADAQVLETIDIVAKVKEADIVVRFTNNILYLRHSPPNEGKSVRIFLRLTDPALIESEIAQETMQSPAADRVPNARVIFPELINGMLVTFSQRTRYSVRAGVDGRSIIITVPYLPEVAKPTAPTSAAVLPTPTSQSGDKSSLTASISAKMPLPVTDPVGPATPALPNSAAAPSSNLTATASSISAPAEQAVTASEIDAQAKAYLVEARKAIASKDLPTAINRLNRILGLPRNSQTEPAQALIGEARELNAEHLKAKAEYELYLNLFPAGPAATKIKARLAALPKDDAARAAVAKPLPKEAGEAEWSYNGNVSAYYYTGKSHIETLTPPAPGQLTFNQDTLSAVDQRSLISSLNLNIRRRDAFSDTRIVFRDTDNHNDLSPSRSYNRIYSAYADHTDKRLGYNLRVGRQNPNGLGVLDRFDGVQGSYNFNPSWRVNAVYGDAVEFGSPFKKSFYGASVDLLTGQPNLSVYAIQQTIDGLLNRRALGTEARYFSGRASAYAMLDYDVLYKGINIALLQGNYLDEARNNYYFVIDHRRAPSYSLTNALAGAPGLNLKDLVSAQGIETVRQQAINLSAMSDLISIGVNHPLSERWQVGADYRLSQISSTSPVNAVIPLAVIGTCLGTIDPINNTCIITTDSQNGSGKNHVVTLQAIGNSLFFTNAVGVVNLSLIKSPTYDGQSSSISYVLPIGERWRFDTNLRYYSQKDNAGGTQDRFSPSFKAAWQWQNRLYIEGEAGRETAKTNSPIRTDHSTRDYVYLGLRGDFR